MTKNGGTLTYRVGQLEKNYETLDGKIEKLLVNDIPHLQQSMSSLKVRMDVLTIVNVGSLIIALLINKFF